MTNSYTLLNRELRFYIHEKGRGSLTRIQNAAIKAMFQNENNLILSAATASGKTEAAFLPAISKVDDWKNGVKILYISPLIALINDQFRRITDMCMDLDMPVTSWHGEASKSKKDKLIENPKGILLITPESIEAMLSSKVGLAKHIFSDIEYIIVDEIHGFIVGNRGIQLRSLLTRIQRYTYNNPRMIGLSATIGEENYDLAKSFFQNGRDTNILVDKSANKLIKSIDYFPSEYVSEESIVKIYEYAKEGPMLVFPNSRDKVETIAVELDKEIKKNYGDISVFAHHSSVSKKRRQEIEAFAQEAKYQNFVICATSTLELGIDIGTVTSVTQYGSAHSVLSLAQRLGRSGRHTKENIIHQISINPWDLLQSIAILTLYEDGILDKLEPATKAYDVFAHQILSTLLENFGLSILEYDYLNKSLPLFSDINDDEFEEITHHMKKEGYIEVLENEVITGLSIEKLMRVGNFYNQFVLSSVYNVYNDKGKIGEIDIRPDIQVDTNIYLAGSIRKIEQILPKNKKIIVTKANAGKAPKFTSIGDMDISSIVRDRMKQILDYPDIYEFDKQTESVLEDIREEYTNDEYIFIASKDQISLRTFKSSKVNRTIAMMLNIATQSTDYNVNELDSTINGPETARYFDEIRLHPISYLDIFNFLKKRESLIEAYLTAYKYMILVPLDLKIKYTIENRLDLKGAYEYLKIKKDNAKI